MEIYIPSLFGNNISTINEICQLDNSKEQKQMCTKYGISYSYLDTALRVCKPYNHSLVYDMLLTCTLATRIYYDHYYDKFESDIKHILFGYLNSRYFIPYESKTEQIAKLALYLANRFNSVFKTNELSEILPSDSKHSNNALIIGKRVVRPNGTTY